MCKKTYLVVWRSSADIITTLSIPVVVFALRRFGFAEFCATFTCYVFTCSVFLVGPLRVSICLLWYLEASCAPSVQSQSTSIRWYNRKESHVLVNMVSVTRN